MSGIDVSAVAIFKVGQELSKTFPIINRVWYNYGQINFFYPVNSKSEIEVSSDPTVSHGTRRSEPKQRRRLQIFKVEVVRRVTMKTMKRLS